MPFSTEFSADGAGVFHRGEGVLTAAEAIAGAAEDHRSPERARRLRYVLADLSGVSELRVTAADMPAIVREHQVTASLTPHAVVAVVAPADLVFGMSRMWQVLSEETGWRSQVFRARDEAIAWLREMLPELAI